MTLAWQRHNGKGLGLPDRRKALSVDCRERRAIPARGNHRSLRLAPPTDGLRRLLLIVAPANRYRTASPRPPVSPAGWAGGSPRRFQATRWRPGVLRHFHSSHSSSRVIGDVQPQLGVARWRLADVVGEHRAVRRIRRRRVPPRRLDLGQLVEQVGVAKPEEMRVLCQRLRGTARAGPSSRRARTRRARTMPTTRSFSRRWITRSRACVVGMPPSSCDQCWPPSTVNQTPNSIPANSRLPLT